MTKITNHLAFILLVLLFCFLSSVVMSDLKEPTQFGKYFVFSFAVSSLLVLYCLGLLKSQDIRLNVIDILLSVLMIFIIFNSYVLQDISGFSFRFHELIGLAVVYILLRRFAIGLSYHFFCSVLIGGVIQAIYGQLQLHGYTQSNHGVFRVTGSFFNPGPYAGYLASVFPIALGISLYRGKLHLALPVKYLSLIAVGGIILILPVTQSRASWVAVIAASVFLCMERLNVEKLLKQHVNTLRKKVLMFAFFLIFLVSFATSMYYLKEGSSSGRLFIWKITGDMIGDHLLKGVGFDQFKSVYMNYQADFFRANINYSAVNTADDVEYTFNELIQFIAENGLPATIILAVLLFYLFRAKKISNIQLAIAKAGLLSCIVFSLFSYPSQILVIKFNCVLFIAVIASTAKYKTLILIKASRAGFKIVAFCSLFVAVFVFIRINIYNSILYDSLKRWDTAYTIYNEGSYVESSVYYSKIYPVFSCEGEFLIQYGKALSLARKHEKALYILNRAQKFQNSFVVQIAKGDSYMALKKFKQAEEAYYSAWYMVPSRFYPRYLLAKLYLESNQKNKAISIAHDLLAMKTKIQSPAVEQMIREMKDLIKQLE